MKEIEITNFASVTNPFVPHDLLITIDEWPDGDYEIIGIRLSLGLPNVKADVTGLIHDKDLDRLYDEVTDYLHTIEARNTCEE